MQFISPLNEGFSELKFLCRVVSHEAIELRFTGTASQRAIDDVARSIRRHRNRIDSDSKTNFSKSPGVVPQAIAKYLRQPLTTRLSLSNLTTKSELLLSAASNQFGDF